VVALSHSQQRLALEAEGWLELRLAEEALPRIEILLHHPAARPVGLHLRVRAFVELARYRDALSDLAELEGYEHDPDWLDFTEAWCRKRTADLTGAIQCMRRVIERDQRSAIGHFNLGCYLALHGELADALDEVSLACGLDPNFRRLAAAEQDLEPLHPDPRFQALILASERG
jgi:tetratricopeptide (TPR) repeat protein